MLSVFGEMVEGIGVVMGVEHEVSFFGHHFTPYFELGMDNVIEEFYFI
jgi:hypothetical protein